jgi:hypothetical protein
MNVRELMAELQKFDQSLEVLCCTDDVEFLATGNSLRVLEVERVESIAGKRDRDEDNAPTLLEAESEDERSESVCLWVTSHL